MNKLLGVLGCLALVAFLASATLAVIYNSPVWFAAEMAVAAGWAAGWALAKLRRERARVAALVGVLAEHYRAQYDMVHIGLLATLLNDAGLNAARAELRELRNLELAQRYAKGDASDY